MSCTQTLIRQLFWKKQWLTEDYHVYSQYVVSCFSSHDSRILPSPVPKIQVIHRVLSQNSWKTLCPGCTDHMIFTKIKVSHHGSSVVMCQTVKPLWLSSTSFSVRPSCHPPSLPPTLRRHDRPSGLQNRRHRRVTLVPLLKTKIGEERVFVVCMDGVWKGRDFVRRRGRGPSLCLWLRVWIRKWLWLIFFRWHVPTSCITPLTGLFHTILNFFNNSTVHIHVHFLLIIVDCLLWIDKTRDKDKTYIWVSVWWNHLFFFLFCLL